MKTLFHENSHFLGVPIRLGTILGRFSIMYFRGLGLGSGLWFGLGLVSVLWLGLAWCNSQGKFRVRVRIRVTVGFGLGL